MKQLTLIGTALALVGCQQSNVAETMAESVTESHVDDPLREFACRNDAYGSIGQVKSYLKAIGFEEVDSEMERSHFVSSWRSGERMYVANEYIDSNEMCILV